MASSTEYSIKAKIASLGYLVFKETTWDDVKESDSVRVDLETNKLSKNVDPYACAIRAKNYFFNLWKTVGHIPKEISYYVYYFIKTEVGFVNGSAISTNFHHQFHLVDWKFHGCLNFRARNRRRLKK